MIVCDSCKKECTYWNNPMTGEESQYLVIPKLIVCSNPNNVEKTTDCVVENVVICEECRNKGRE